MTIDMTGRAEAQAWLQEAQMLNDRTEQLLDEVSRTLQEIKEESEGSIVDEIFSLGNKVSTATRTMMGAMNQISQTINSILTALTQVLSDGVQTVVSASGVLFGG